MFRPYHKRFTEVEKKEKYFVDDTEQGTVFTAPNVNVALKMAGYKDKADFIRQHGTEHFNFEELFVEISARTARKLINVDGWDEATYEDYKEAFSKSRAGRFKEADTAYYVDMLDGIVYTAPDLLTAVKMAGYKNTADYMTKNGREMGGEPMKNVFKRLSAKDAKALIDDGWDSEVYGGSYTANF